MSEELSPIQMDAFRERLETLASELQDLLNNTETGAQPVQLKDNQGRLSRMDEMHNQSILLANRNLTKNRLRAVILAAKRIDEGRYGYCALCDEVISIARLEAYPEANKCIVCQSKTDESH
jgi:DnaK suppressor protein